MKIFRKISEWISEWIVVLFIGIGVLLIVSHILGIFEPASIPDGFTPEDFGGGTFHLE